MTDDILRRLKEQHHNTNVLDGDLMREAAAEIEKLRAELEALKKYEREKWTGWAAALKETGDGE